MDTIRDMYIEHMTAHYHNRDTLLRAIAEAEAEFDEALREAREEAFKEGFIECANWWEIHHADSVVDQLNPYRKTEETS